MSNAVVIGGSLAGLCSARVLAEHFDVAVRIAHMPDSALFATPVGAVRRIVVASPKYLAARGRPHAPKDLTAHRCISFSATTPTDSWTFGPGASGGRARQVKIDPVLSVNTAEAALAGGEAELISFGAPYLANPDLPARFLAGAPLNAPDHTTFYSEGAKGYVDYPALAAG